MASITYIQTDGERQTVDVKKGTTVKDGALQNDIEGIVAECGGNAMCATCHVFVDEEWIDRLPAMEEIEDDLLDDAVTPRQATSRLSCQLEMTDDLDGLTVTMPAEQE